MVFSLRLSTLLTLTLAMGFLSCLQSARANEWDCAQSGPNKEWVCGSDKPVASLQTTTPETPLKDDILKTDSTEAKATDPATANAISSKNSTPALSGWSCTAEDSEGGEQGWKCSLKGHDPKGRAHQVVDETADPDDKPQNWSEANEITQEDEWRFERLLSLSPTDPWKNACKPKAGKSGPPPLAEFLVSPADKQARDKAPAEIHSDHFELVGGEVANFSGGVEMVKADQKLWADYVSQNIKSNIFNSHGNVVYMEKGNLLSSDTGYKDMTADRGVFRNSQFILPLVPARGVSRKTYVDSNTLTRYETVSYTTCPPGNQDWVMHADKVTMNKETGMGTAKSAWFEFMDIPVFWTPSMNFPVDQRRISGFLDGNIGASKVNGVDIRVPYYFNLAPNYDITIEPRYMTERGFMLKNEFRYLSSWSKGTFSGAILPEDQQTHTTRWQFAMTNSTQFTETLKARANIYLVSDANYQAQLGTSLGIPDFLYGASYAWMDWNSPLGNVGLMANYFQSLVPDTPQDQYPYFYAPQINHNYSASILNTGLRFNLPTQWTYLMTAGSQQATGQRLSIRPNISLPLESAAWYFKPSATMALNQYLLDGPQYWTAKQLANGVVTDTNSTETLAVPIFSVDSGTFFDRDASLFGSPAQHTIEPKLFYVYIPKVNQNNIPVFDSGEYDFTYYQLFRENRFTGYDRIGDTNQLTAAIINRMVDSETGQEKLRFTFGNQAYFQDRSVSLWGPPPPIYNQSFSNLIGDIYTTLTDNWSVYMAGQYNVGYSQVSRGQAGLQYNNRQNQILNLVYRYRLNQYNTPCDPSNPNNGCLNLTDVSFRLPIPVFSGWFAVGRWEYSFLNNTTLETFFGLEKETCCYRFALLGRHYLNSLNAATTENPYTTASTNNAIFLQFELKGLTSLDNGYQQFLQRSMTGYRFADY